VPAAILSVGAVTGHGLGAGRLFTALLEGRTAIGPARSISTAGLCSDLAAEVPGELGGASRCEGLLLAAAREALAHGTWEPSARRGVVVGTTKGALEVAVAAWTAGRGPAQDPVAAPAWALAAEVGARGPVMGVCGACASSTLALGRALAWIEEGTCDEVVVAGAEALHAFVYSGFHALKALSPKPAAPFDARRAGLSVGEGAAVLVLASLRQADRTGRAPLAYLDGAGAAGDAFDQTAPDPAGGGLMRACRQALVRAGCQAQDVGCYVAHGTATPQNDRMEAAAYADVFGGAPVPLCAFKGSVGHTLGAAGALDVVASVLALQSRMLPAVTNLETVDPELPVHPVLRTPQPLRGDRILVGAAGFGGINAALVLRRAEGA
jgi:3-oxoacyl-(acyl-carrier-protein) synthase